MNNTKNFRFLIPIVAALFFIPGLGGVHLFDWDEINFAEAAREMLLLQDYLRVHINFQPFWEKPPLFIWLQAISMNLFGANEFAARFPNAIAGILTLFILFKIGSLLYDESFGFIWALTYFGSVLPFLYFKSGIIDPWFNLFIFLGIYYFILFYWKKENRAESQLKRNMWVYLVAGGLSIGLGILTKGPVALLIAALVLGIYWLYKRFQWYAGIHHFTFYAVLALLIPAIWFGVETLKNGPWFVTEFFQYQYRLFSTPDAGHGGFPGYHFVVLLIGCFPASIFALKAFFKCTTDEHSFQNDYRLWMKILFWVVLILFTIVKSKIVHYSSLCYFPLTYLAAWVVYHNIHKKIEMNTWVKTGLAFIAGLFILVTLALPFLMPQAQNFSHLIDDAFARGNLEAEVNWSGFEIIPGVFLLGVLIWFLTNFKSFMSIKNYIVIFSGTAVFVMLTLYFFINRIEGYSQNAAIEFFKSKAGEDAYVITVGYKSYADLFYTQKPKPTREESYNRDWLLSGEADKPVYISVKIHQTHELLNACPEAKELYRKNGFVFYVREKNITQ